MASIEDTRAVVEAGETFDGKIYPSVHAEIDRPVRINEDATVEGSVYGASVELDPGATVEGSVMASDSIELDGATVTGEVGSPGRVVADDSEVGGTVVGQRVTLEDSLVRGNVAGTDVVLDTCLVLGIASADGSLALETTLCYTFRSSNETTLDGATVVLPQAVADGPLTMETPVSVAGLGRLSVEDEEGSSDHPRALQELLPEYTDASGMGGEESDGRLPEMTEEDLHTQHGTTYLTLAPRVLNLEKVTDRLDELETRVLEVVEGAKDDDPMDVGEVLASLDVHGETA